MAPTWGLKPSAAQLRAGRLPTRPAGGTTGRAAPSHGLWGTEPLGAQMTLIPHRGPSRCSLGHSWGHFPPAPRPCGTFSPFEILLPTASRRNSDAGRGSEGGAGTGEVPRLQAPGTPVHMPTRWCMAFRDTTSGVSRAPASPVTPFGEGQALAGLGRVKDQQAASCRPPPLPVTPEACGLP